MNVVARAAAVRKAREAEQWMTVPEIAAAVRVSNMTIYREIERGNLHARRIGRSLRIKRAWFAEWSNDNGNPYGAAS